MRPLALLVVVMSLFALGCRSSSSLEVVDADPAAREALLATVTGLDGRWETTGHDGETVTTVFAVSSAGSAVRELMMEGTDHEMTNMYTLDGNDLVMTHYCAGGNQPSMRASSVEDGRVVFRFEGVQDLKAPDEAYMGAMTLVLIDDDHVEQHWSAFKGDQLDHEMTITLKRVR